MATTPATTCVSKRAAFIPALVWLVYRRLRALGCTMGGRNPLARGRSAMSLAQEWKSIRGLRKALKAPPSPREQDADGRIRWNTAVGAFWTPKGAGLDYVGRLAAEMLANVYPFHGDGQSVVLDCGANVGFFSRFALDNGAGHVIALEPSPDNARCLRRNLAAEIGSGKLAVIEKGVWDGEAVLTFSTANVNNPGGHHVVEGDTGDIRIPVISIDRVCEELRLTRVDYIKIDVEGSEVRAISGAVKVIQKFRPRLCVATEHTDDMYANTVAVIEAVRMIDSSYHFLCTEAHLYSSPTKGIVLTPFNLLFVP